MLDDFILARLCDLISCWVILCLEGRTLNKIIKLSEIVYNKMYNFQIKKFQIHAK